MAIPTFSFGSYASDLVSPNRVLVPTRLTAADRPVAERYKTETEAYNQAMDKYRQDVEAYNAALETYNAGPRDKEFTIATPTAPANLGYTQEDVDAFSEASASRAAAQQAARQNALNIIMNPEGFSQQYGIGSLAFADGGVVDEGIGSLPFEEDLYRMESNPKLGFGAYGIRHSGEGLKGKGYFGEISSPNGQVVTEYSVYDEDIGEYPSIVPTLTREEITDTISRSTKGEQPSIEVIRKARRHAIERLSEGKSPFSGNTELRFPLPSGASEDLINRIARYLENKRPND